MLHAAKTIILVYDELEGFFIKTCHGIHLTAVGTDLSIVRANLRVESPLPLLIPNCSPGWMPFSSPFCSSRCKIVIKISSCCDDRLYSSCRTASGLTISLFCNHSDRLSVGSARSHAYLSICSRTAIRWRYIISSSSMVPTSLDGNHRYRVFIL